MAILTTTQYKALVGISGSTYDARLDIVIPAVQSMLERMSGRLFDEASHIEYQNGRGTAELLVNNPPISSVNTITIVDASGTTIYTIPATSYTVVDGPDNLEAGVITIAPALTIMALDPDYAAPEVVGYRSGPCFPNGERNIKIQYTGGYASAAMPGELKLDVARLVGIAMSQTAGIVDLSMKSERLGDYSYDRGSGSTSGFGSDTGALGQSALTLDAACYGIAQKWKVHR